MDESFKERITSRRKTTSPYIDMDIGDDGFSTMFGSGEYLPDEPAFEIDKNIDKYFHELHMKKKKEGKKVTLVSKKKLKRAEKRIQELEAEIKRLRKENEDIRKWDEI